MEYLKKGKTKQNKTIILINKRKVAQGVTLNHKTIMHNNFPLILDDENIVREKKYIILIQTCQLWIYEFLINFLTYRLETHSVITQWNI